MTGHAAGFARYWNRPMDGGWRRDFLFQFTFLVVLCTLGGAYPYIGAFFFSLTVLTWTREAIRGYRRGRRAGDRDEHHDRDDTWKDGMHG